MRVVVFLVVSVLVVLFTGCKSKDVACNKCPYESVIENIPLELNTIPQLHSDSLHVNVADILPTELLDIRQLIEYLSAPLFPLHKDVINKAFDYAGVRYRRGGASLNGMDCSGLVYTCYSAFGISLPRSSADMAVSNSIQDISRNEAKTGDIIFFRTNRRHGRINHVGLVVEVNNHEIKFIHASIQRGVIVSSTQEDYYARTFAKVGRVLRS
ncbi:C40 family peptidase [Viscerimonas tarda]